MQIDSDVIDGFPEAFLAVIAGLLISSWTNIHFPSAKVTQKGLSIDYCAQNRWLTFVCSQDGICTVRECRYVRDFT